MIIRTYGGKTPDRIAIHADDLNVGTYLAYVNGDDVACYDSAGRRTIGSAKLEDLFIKGLLLYVNNAFYKPISMETVDKDIVLTYLVYDDNTDAMVKATVSSDDTVPPPSPPPKLDSLSLGGKTLTPPYDWEISTYSVITEDPADVLVLVTDPIDAEVIVKLDGTPIEDYGFGIDWTNPQHLLTVQLIDPNAPYDPITYNITVNYIEAPPLPKLTSLSFDAGSLSPTFASDVFTYDFVTEAATNAMDFIVDPMLTDVIVELDSVESLDYNTVGFTWTDSQHIVTIKLGTDVLYTINVSVVEPSTEPRIVSFELSNVTLEEEFDEEVFTYTGTGTEDPAVLVFVTDPTDVDTTVKLNDIVVSDYGQGFTWVDGSNTLVIELDHEGDPIAYTFTISFSTPKT